MAKDVKKTQSIKEDKLTKKENNKRAKVVIDEVTTVEAKKENKKLLKKEVRKDKTSGIEKIEKTVNLVDDNRKLILALVVGFLLSTLLFRCILWPDRIATLSDGTQPVAVVDGENYTADQLYEDMKEQFSVNVLLNEIDNKILTKLYPENDEMIQEVKDNAEYYYYVYEQNYGYTKETFLSTYGFENETAFLESLKLDYRRNEYYEDYADSLVTDAEMDKYYKNEVFGDVDSKHILVKIDEENGVTDEDAKKLAKEIISKLDSGTSWEDVVKEYGDKIVSEELGYNPFNASLEASYLKECKNLEVGKYSKTPVLTSYGYHVVYKIAQKDKPSLEDVRDDVIAVLADEKKEKDSNLYYKSLIEMRKEAKLEFVDTKLNEEYQEYIKSYK